MNNYTSLEEMPDHERFAEPIGLVVERNPHRFNPDYRPIWLLVSTDPQHSTDPFKNFVSIITAEGVESLCELRDDGILKNPIKAVVPSEHFDKAVAKISSINSFQGDKRYMSHFVKDMMVTYGTTVKAFDHTHLEKFTDYVQDVGLTQQAVDALSQDDHFWCRMMQERGVDVQPMLDALQMPEQTKEEDIELEM